MITSHLGILIVSGFGYTKQKGAFEKIERVYYANELKYAHAQIIQKPACLEIYQKLKIRSVVKALTHRSKDLIMCALGEENEGVSNALNLGMHYTYNINLI
jgi:hypothetical protein